MKDGTSSLNGAPRHVTILGATGSIGSSTVDLLKRGNGRFTVEALTAHKNGAALAKLAAISARASRRLPITRPTAS